VLTSWNPAVSSWILVKEILNLLSHTCFLGVKLSLYIHFGVVPNISFNVYKKHTSDILNFLFLYCDMAAENPEKGAGRNGYSSASMLTSLLAGYHLTTHH
jgi:hypothetical protein